MKKKTEELRYESIKRVARWNLCQQLLSEIYWSLLTDTKIKKLLLNVYDIENEFSKQLKNK